jgi:large subunit ribosomal protein L25
VAGERVKLEVRVRETRGDGPARRMRAEGLIPGVLYGRAKTPHVIEVEERELRRALHGPGGMHTILDVVVGDQATAHPSVVKDFQQHPVSGRLLHIDLQEVRLDQPITVAVSVHLLGESPGAKEGGILSQQIREVNVEALPMEVPEHLELDISSLQMGDSLRVADVPSIEGVTYLDDPDTVLVTVMVPRAIEIEEPVEGEEGEEGEEGAVEGEAAPDGEAESSDSE